MKVFNIFAIIFAFAVPSVFAGAESTTKSPIGFGKENGYFSASPNNGISYCYYDGTEGSFVVQCSKYLPDGKSGMCTPVDFY